MIKKIQFYTILLQGIKNVKVSLLFFTLFNYSGLYKNLLFSKR